MIYYAPPIKAQQDRVEHNISTGNLVIKDSGTYYVTGTSSSYHITILKDSEPTVILDNVSIETKGRHHAIKLEDNAKLTLTLIGENFISNVSEYCNYGAIRVKGEWGIDNKGELTQTVDQERRTATLKIDGDGHLKIINTTSGAAIGGDGRPIPNSLDAEAAGIIDIGGQAKIEIYAKGNGAGIGGGGSPGDGQHEKLTCGAGGILCIQDNAYVEVTSEKRKASAGGTGAAIGGGERGSTGQILITGDAVVKAYGRYMGAAIGGGYNSSLGIGSIKMMGRAKVNAEADHMSAAIGGGCLGTNAPIEIGEEAKVEAITRGSGAAIGSGYNRKGGYIIIKDKAEVEAISTHTGCCIGGGSITNLEEDIHAKGSIVQALLQLMIQDAPKVSLKAMGIGPALSQVTDKKGTIINGGTVSIQADKGETIVERINGKELTLTGGSLYIFPLTRSYRAYDDENSLFPVVIETAFNNQEIKYSIEPEESYEVMTDHLGRFYPWLGEGQYHLVIHVGGEQYLYEVVVEAYGKNKVTYLPTPKCLCGNIEITFEDRQLQWEEMDEGGILLEGRAELKLNDCPYHLEDEITLSYSIDKEKPNTAEGTLIGEEGDRLKLAKAGEVTVIALGREKKSERLAEKKAVFTIIPEAPKEEIPEKEEPKEGGTPEKEEPKEGGIPEKEEQNEGATPNKEKPEEGGTPEKEEPNKGDTPNKEEPEEGGTPEKEEPNEGGTSEKEEPNEGSTPENEQKGNNTSREEKAQREVGLEEQKSKEEIASQGIKATQQGSVVFKDIETHWAKEAIYFLIERGFFEEVEEERFYPDSPLNRRIGIEIVEKLGTHQIQGPNEVERNKDESRKEESLRQTSSLIEDFITREEMVALLYEQACNQNKSLTVKDIPSTFYDYEEIDEQAREAVRAFEQAGLIVGRRSFFFEPKEKLTRGEFAKLLQKYICLEENK